jgi:hypothetical protein
MKKIIMPSLFNQNGDLVGSVYVFIDGGERDLGKLDKLVCNGVKQREKQLRKNKNEMNASITG